MSKIGLFSREISPLLSMSVQSIQLSGLVVIWDCEHLSDKWVILAALLLQEWLQNCDLISFLLFFLFILKNKNAYIFILTIWSLAGRWAMNIFSDLGNSQISKCFCLSFFFFFLSTACPWLAAQYTYCKTTMPITIFHTTQKYFQFNPNNLNKWKRELVLLLQFWVKKKKRLVRGKMC